MRVWCPTNGKLHSSLHGLRCHRIQTWLIEVCDKICDQHIKDDDNSYKELEFDRGGGGREEGEGGREGGAGGESSCLHSKAASAWVLLSTGMSMTSFLSPYRPFLSAGGREVEGGRGVKGRGGWRWKDWLTFKSCLSVCTIIHWYQYNILPISIQTLPFCSVDSWNQARHYVRLHQTHRENSMVLLLSKYSLTGCLYFLN